MIRSEVAQQTCGLEETSFAGDDSDRQAILDDAGRPASIRPGAEDGATSTIGEVARDFAVSLRTLRFYEDRNLLAPRRIGASRIYDAGDRARLAVILKAKQLGFTLTEIRGMLADKREIGGPDAMALPLSLAQIDSQIAHLTAQKAEVEQALAELSRRRAALTMG